MILRRRILQLTSAAALIVAGSSMASADHAADAGTEPNPMTIAQASTAPGAYFGLKLPGEKPELFAPGIINVPGRSVGRIAFSPGATECALTVFESIYANNRILFTRYENGAWTPQSPGRRVDGREILEPFFSRDDSRIFFTAKSTGDSPNADLWEARRIPQGWSEPQPLPGVFNSDQNEFCLAQTADGTMYFASGRQGGHGGLDLYRAVAKPGHPAQVENLGTPVNSESDDGDPGISPDGHILIFYSASNRPRRVTGNSDLFICFDHGRGGWTRPVNMGEGFNTPAAEYGATFSLDGRVLFFVRFDGKKGEVHWVSTAALERFRDAPDTTASMEEISLPPEKKMVTVPSEILQRYVGTYEGEPQSAAPASHITLEAGQLMLRVGGQPKVPLFAESETKFFPKVVEADIEFLKSGQGEITALVIHQNGMDFKLPRKAEPLKGASPP